MELSSVKQWIYPMERQGSIFGSGRVPEREKSTWGMHRPGRTSTPNELFSAMRLSDSKLVRRALYNGLRGGYEGWSGRQKETRLAGTDSPNRMKEAEEKPAQGGNETVDVFPPPATPPWMHPTQKTKMHHWLFEQSDFLCFWSAVPIELWQQLEYTS